MMGDLINRETDMDFFLPFIQSKSDATLISLVQGLLKEDEIHKLESLLQNHNKDSERLAKAFERYSSKKPKTISGRQSPELEKLLSKIRKIAAKGVARDLKVKLST